MSHVFAAKFPGRCGQCDEPFSEGSRVRYEDDELVHAACSEGPVKLTKIPACPDCWLVHAGGCYE